VTVDEHLDRALASLDEVPVRELEAVRGSQPPSSHDFAGIFRNAAHAREGGWSPSLPRFHLGQAVSRGGDELAEQIAGAEAPFWRHVGDALRARP
jgi:hypothetical protein